MSQVIRVVIVDDSETVIVAAFVVVEVFSAMEKVAAFVNDGML